MGVRKCIHALFQIDKKTNKKKQTDRQKTDIYTETENIQIARDGDGPTDTQTDISSSQILFTSMTTMTSSVGKQIGFTLIFIISNIFYFRIYNINKRKQ